MSNCIFCVPSNALEKQFKEPHDMWDAYCEWKEREYRQRICDKTCLDCAKSVTCDIKGHETVGWCTEIEDFVSNDELVSDLGLECFEEA